MSKVSRRDFLRLGSLAALSAPVVSVIGKIGDQEIVESKEEFGGFTIRRHTKENPPYQVDDSMYKRPDARKALDPMKLQLQPDNAIAKMENRESGYARYECAFHSSAWTVAMGLGTNGGAMTNCGLYSWDVIPNAYGPGSPKFFELPRWDPAGDGLSTEDVTNMVKKVAKFYGASLVGIAPVDERWFYSKVIDMDPFEMMNDSSFLEEAGFELPETSSGASPRSIVQNAMLGMDKNDMKDMIIAATESVDPSVLPEGLTIGAIKAMPAGMFQKMLPNVITTFSNEYLYAMAERVPGELYPPDFDPKAILEEEFVVVDMSEAIPSASINFYEGEKSYFDDSEGEGKGKYFVSRNMKYAIVMAFEMDEDGIGTEHGMIPEAAVAIGYSKMAFTSGSLAQFLRDLGYSAIPMGNDTSLSIPMAIDAGLGELSRAGWLITPKYGPRVRLSKVVTDLPLVPDQPISFGVTEFCEVCGKCAKDCPSGAINPGERNYDAPQPTGNPGVFKWATNGAKCQQYWTDSGVSCSLCIGVCPFNKPEGWLHEATRILIGARSGSIDNILLKLDDVSGYGMKSKISSQEFWEKDEYIHIKS